MLYISFVAVLTCLPAILAQGNSTNSTGSAQELPVVDLGYGLQQATSYNGTGEYYEFKNIRYAAPPLGNLRFRRPRRPETNRTIENGQQGRSCPQAFPPWVIGSQGFAYAYRPRQSVNASDYDTTNIQPSPPSGSDTEDCLFLDVTVPKAIFEKAEDDDDAENAVLVWIHGGGYTLGSKNSFSRPEGIIARSQECGDAGVIFVSINYRLGAFGWLAGPSVQADGVANAGLWDQRFALQWVQRHIHKFGGCSSKVTVIGESAGGGSIMHQITAFGGERGNAPFQQAIMQSPAFRPTTSNFVKENTYLDFIKLLNAANIKQIASSPWGRFGYGPVVDGFFVPDLPGVLLQRGQYDGNVRVMLGHNANEGILFTPPFVQNDSAFDALLTSYYPAIQTYPELKNYITKTLYPAVFNGTYGYLENIGRAALAISESIFTCNTFYLSKAYHNETYSYEFAVPPGIHGQDIPYTFYTGALEADNHVAFALQRWITSFAIYSTPNYGKNPFFPQYQRNATINIVNVTGISIARDDNASERCNWWQKALYA